MSFRDAFQELRELGPSATVFRAVWEFKMRTGLMERLATRSAAIVQPVASDWYERTPFESPAALRAWFESVPQPSVTELRRRALAAGRGEIVCFGRWPAQFGDPIDWHRDPVTGGRWPADVHWSRAMQNAGAGDVKCTWEVARFPHAFLLARAAAADPEIAERCAVALASQIAGFRAANPRGKGIHWASGLEIALRVMSWSFAASVFGRLRLWDSATLNGIAAGLLESATHIDDYFSFAEHSVANDHLIGEAVALLMIATLFPDGDAPERWMKKAVRTLTREADAQIYPDGAYLMHSHNYHRSVVQYYVLASAFLRHLEREVPRAWTNAIARSVRFLAAHINPADGRLPNSGSNDGGLPLPLTSCDYADYRPALQAANVVANGTRLWPEGPWDEEALWLAGRDALERRIEPPPLHTMIFADSGYAVLRSADDPSTFAAFRCGSIRNRFPQIDMLHVDFWWKGINVLVDGGSYLYNGPREWHDYFYRTSSHNTVVIDGADQMRHHRQFKVLYWTKARVREFQASGEFQLIVAEHYGYRRLPGHCIHTRSLLLAGSDVCIVYDAVNGVGEHDLRLHWQAADFPAELDSRTGTLLLDVAGSRFAVVVIPIGATAAQTSMAAGQTAPIRGWYSRYYGEKVGAPSLAIEATAALPAGFLTVFGLGVPTVESHAGRWRVEGMRSVVEFTTTAEQIVASDIAVRARQ